MPILGHPAYREHGPALVAPAVFAVSAPTPAPAAAAPCAGCQYAPMTCEDGCGHTCCCPDSYPLPAAAEELRIVDSRGAADFAAFAELLSGRRVVVLVDEAAEFYDRAADRRAAALAQRAEIHVGLDDELLVDLAARAVYGGRTAVGR